MDSLALRAVFSAEQPAAGGAYSDDLYHVGQRPRGTHRNTAARPAAVAIPWRSHGGSFNDPTTGEGSLVMDDRYAYVPDDDAEAADDVRRAVQVAMDRRDNGGVAS